MVYPVLQMGNGGSDNFIGSDQVLRQGFDIRWKAHTSIRIECTMSGGRCGYSVGLKNGQNKLFVQLPKLSIYFVKGIAQKVRSDIFND